MSLSLLVDRKCTCAAVCAIAPLLQVAAVPHWPTTRCNLPRQVGHLNWTPPPYRVSACQTVAALIQFAFRPTFDCRTNVCGSLSLSLSFSRHKHTNTMAAAHPFEQTVHKKLINLAGAQQTSDPLQSACALPGNCVAAATKLNGLLAAAAAAGRLYCSLLLCLSLPPLCSGETTAAIVQPVPVTVSRQSKRRSQLTFLRTQMALIKLVCW